MRDRLIELIRDLALSDEPCVDGLFEWADTIADHLLAEGVIVAPCKVGDIVYKICPKCNNNHNKTCKYCTWSGCFMTGCDIGVRVYWDGSCGDYELQIVPYKVAKDNIITIFQAWNVMYFTTEEQANTAKEEYDIIRKIEDRHKRYEAYKAWESKRKTHYVFLGEE